MRINDNETRPVDEDASLHAGTAAALDIASMSSKDEWPESSRSGSNDFAAVSITVIEEQKETLIGLRGGCCSLCQ